MKLKENTYVEVLNREGNILGDRGIYRGNPTGKIVKVFSDKYKVRISAGTYIYCKEKEVRDAKIVK